MVAQLDKLYIKTRPSKAVSRLISYALFEGRPLTTKGRWVNPLIFAHFALEANLPQLKEVEKPIFIIGTGRSGTTVLGVLMSMHREIGFLNEPKALWHSIYPYEDVIGNYSMGSAQYLLGEKNATEEVRCRARRLFGAYLRAVGSNRVVDKYPELIFRVPFVRAIFPDAKFVFLVRNGWDTCRSIENWSGRLGVQSGGESHDWWGVDNRKWHFMLEQLVPQEEAFTGVVDVLPGLTNHTDMAAVEWVLTMQEGLRQRRRAPECIHMLHYEALVENPRNELSRLLDFCELPNDELFINFAEQRLGPAPQYEPVDLHPAVRQPFIDTMKALGY